MAVVIDGGADERGETVQVDPRPGAVPLRFADVVLTREGTPILDGVNWTVAAGARWIVIGPNGCGKTTLLQLATGYLHPTAGTVEVLGHRLGRVDVRELRRHVSLVSAALLKRLEPGLTGVEVVLTGADAALATWWHEYTDDDRSRALALLEAAGAAHLADRPLAVLSEGERQQVQLARSLMGAPGLLLLDEPAAGLDLGARERLVARLTHLAADRATPPVVFVTHHVEEIPPGFTDCLLLANGRVVAAGPIHTTLTSDALSETFGLHLDLRHDDGRWASVARP